ncbi:MAG: hypothetical protein D4R94_02700 [Chitinophagaceae bacterium]|nr:MAG: hypothetical protein D4R94_02700 [Chitinophagaceae bacterium]
MKNYKILLVALPFMLIACSKGGDSPAPVTPPVVIVPEADIAFKIEIPASTEIDYTKIYGAIGGSQAINVNITSALPKDGVTIDVKVNKDVDNTSVFTNNITSTTAASNAITISSLSPGVLSTATVVVTSKTKSANTSTKTFKIAAK